MVDIGQFDDAPDSATAPHTHFRGDYPYIDSLTHDSDDSEDSDYDEDSLDDEYDTNRVEDEDWEIAERGTHFFIQVLVKLNAMPKISQSNIIAFDSMSQCGLETHRDRLHHFINRFQWPLFLRSTILEVLHLDQMAILDIRINLPLW